MEKLKKANLFRDGIVAVQGALIDRYNKCLQLIGASPTTLKAFTIDGFGWSPEVAEEKNNTFYLNNGEANTHAIIISPLQKGKPVLMPFHSFDRDLQELIFKTYPYEIEDITRDAAIVVDFDQGIDTFLEALDVLKFKTIGINFRLTDRLDKKKRKQEKLIARFKEGNNFIDKSLQKDLLALAEKYGDLRHRNLDLAPLSYEAESFFTEAFGGIYVIRDVEDIVVFTNKDTHAASVTNTSYPVLIYHISQVQLLDKLRDYVIIEHQLKEFVQSDRYDRIKKYLFYHALQGLDLHNSIQEILNDRVLYKGYLNRMDKEVKKNLLSLESFMQQKTVNPSLNPKMFLNSVLYKAIQEPHSSLETDLQELIWKLLVAISPMDPLYLYWYDKKEFYKVYQTWQPSFQDWVIQTINKNIHKST